MRSRQIEGQSLYACRPQSNDSLTVSHMMLREPLSPQEIPHLTPGRYSCFGGTEFDILPESVYPYHPPVSPQLERRLDRGRFSPKNASYCLSTGAHLSEYSPYVSKRPQPRESGSDLC